MKGGLILIFIFLSVIYFADAIYCGDNQLDEGEVCDINRLSWYTCLNFSYDGGGLGCLEDCSGYDYDECYGNDICGNDIVDSSELCDGDNVRGRTCADEGYEGGTLKCGNNCNQYDYSECTGEIAVCGDEMINGTEECDDGLSNETCESKGFDFGVLRCIDCMFNVEQCFNEDAVDETPETSDGEVVVGENLGTETLPGVAGSESSGMKLSTWLLISLGVLIAGIVLIWLFVFKLKK